MRAIAPLPNAIGVPINTKIIAAAFSKPMDPATLTTGTTGSFTLACGAAGTAGTAVPKTLVTGGTVSYLATGNAATLILPAANLPATADCTATVTTGAKDTTGLGLVSNYSWTFSTGVVPDTTQPRVTLTVPATTSPGPTGVPIGTEITATFSKDMDPAKIIASGAFTVTGPGATPVPGTVSYAIGSRIATFTPTTALAASTTYTVTIKGTGALAVSDTVSPPNLLLGNAVPAPVPPAGSDYTWSFTTGVAPDTTKPRVTLTVPATTIPGPTTNVPTNTAITATFTEDMAPATIDGTSFTVTGPGGTPVAGAVTYGTRVATFTPTAVLAAGTTYTVTIKGTGLTPATDIAGNALAGNQAALPAASDYVWTFTTAAAPVPAANVSVLSTNPAAGAAGVCPNASINATFTVPSGLRMDPLSVNAATFTVTGPGATPVTAASVVLDAATGTIATFTPLAALTSGVTYTVTIKSGATGVKDLAIPANTMLADYVWTFTAGPAAANCPAAPALGAAAPFGFFSSAALTNQGDAPNTTINGDIGTTGVATSITGFHDTLGRTYTETCPAGTAAVGCGLVNGTIYASDAPVGGPAGVVGPAAAAALVAFNAISPASTPGGLDVTTNSLVGAGGLANELGGRTLAPGVYYSAAGPGAPAGYQITAGDLTLDAQGNANAVWIFQTAAGTGTLLVSSPTGPVLTVPRTVRLINGAQAKNVFWYVPAGAVINTGSHMVGTMIGNASITFGTATGANPVIVTTLDGRALVLTAGATMVNTVINVPAP